jgi:predicted dinucleotide-binding enzyme
MKIAILGAGNIGGALGKHWTGAGHRIFFGVRNPDKPEVRALLAACGPNASAHSPGQAAQQGEAIVFAIPAAAMTETIAQLAPHLDGKVLIDATNNVRGTPQSAVEALRQAAPKAAIYRAFNSIGWENIENPIYQGVQSDLIFCGSPEQRAAAEQLIAATGMNPVYIGGLDQTAVVDSLTRLWFALAFGQGQGRRIGFKVLRDV